jgi:murein DD-endopeptidase MepM/ murein hydrolase activator NlpD
MTRSQALSILADLKRRLLRLEKKAKAVPTVSSQPVQQTLQLPVPFVAITQPYGTENWTLYPSTGRHWGLDLRAPLNTPVRAPKDGEVIESGYNDSLGYWLQFFDGKIYHVLPHLQGKAKLGKYKQGQEMQKIGNTGKIKGVHCHLECWTERMTDRINQLRTRGTKITLDPVVVYKLK